MSSFRYFLLFSMSLFCFLQTCFANSELDSLINLHMKVQQIPGLGLLVIDKGQIVINQGYGFSNLELKTKVSPQSVFQLASASKPFIALAILKLIENGKITGLDDPIDKYLGNELPASWKQITIRQLLSHTSGIPNLPADLDLQKNYTDAELLELITKENLDFPPGEQWMYSNDGYILLGMIIHKASGMFYGDYLQEIVFKPLGMTSTRVNNLADIIPHRASGYELVDKEIKNQSWVSETLSSTADGSIVTSLEDMAKWNEALDKQQILNKEHYQQWWTPTKLKNGTSCPYGLGWFISNINGFKVIYHPGQWQGFRSMIARYPSNQLSIVLLMNGNYADPVYLAQQAARFYRPELTSKVLIPMNVNPDILKRYSGKYKSEFPPSDAIVSVAADNHLTVTLGKSEMTFIPDSETSFFVPDTVMRLTFQLDKNHNVVSMILHQIEDVQIVFKRSGPPENNPPAPEKIQTDSEKNQSVQAPLIPRSLLFDNPEVTSPKISPDGKKLAYLAPDNQKSLNVWVRDLPNGPDHQVTEDKRGLRNFVWQFDSAHILYLQDNDGDENWHIYQTDLESEKTKDLTPFKGVKAEILALDPHFPQEMLIKMNKRNPSMLDVYRIDFKSGQIVPVLENPGDVIRWVADHNLQVRAALVYETDGTLLIRVLDNKNSGWRTLLTIDQSEIAPDDISGVAAFSADNQSLYLTASLGANTARLLKIDMQTGNRTVVAEDPQYDLSELLLQPTTYVPEAVGVDREHYDWIVLDPTVKEDFNFLFEHLKGHFNITSRDDADQNWIIASESDLQPNNFYIYHRPSKDLEFLFNSKPSLERYSMSPMEAISIQAQDGMSLQGYLTLPHGLKHKDLPAVILVHGGPWLRDSWGFNPVVQWLANRGYAVLQINFRGSKGYGKNILNAGNREWANKMHDDILDGRKWLIRQGYVNSKKIAIYGESYGGFETLVALAQNPDDFCCGVDIVGPSNLLTLLNTLPADWAPIKASMEYRVGKLDEREFLKSRSPLYKADRITKPLLIAQGANDPRVKQAESDQIVAAMRQKNLPVDYLLFKDEGHGIFRQENKLKFYAIAEAFLAKYLGGREEQ